MTMSLTEEQQPTDQYNKANELPTIINNGNGQYMTTSNYLPWKPCMNPIRDIENGIGKTCQLNSMEAFIVPPTYRCVRNPLHTRNTICEWDSANRTNFYLLDSLLEKDQASILDNRRSCKEADDKARWEQKETTLSLGKRISEIIFWRNKIFAEADKMLNESTALNNTKALLDELRELLEETLKIDRECLYLRDKREKMDLAHDPLEKLLVSEVDLILNWKAKIQGELEKIVNQQALNRYAQSHLEKDISDKFTAEELDESAYQKQNTSEGLSCHKDVGVTDSCVSDHKTWLAATLETIKHSEKERNASTLLRRHIDSFIDRLCHEILDHWNKTNEGLRYSIKNILDIRNKLKNRLGQLIAEMFQLNKSIESLRKSIADKRTQLHVANTRLEIRRKRPNMEACRGAAQSNLFKEIDEIKKIAEDLQTKLCYTESVLEEMKSMKTLLEEEIASKNSALYIDREKCLTLRKFFPVLKVLSRRIFLSK
ncbi:tektin-3 [Octopus bimaculoides]|uniref:Tektin n=1 Tax=Octopus bimaculoides TaxID=37653 RepID=A0A0L8H6P2_OCTBM|nr:tektin-3 [Octopus bimaculoides]|eukprot:XP_014774959.1 PREDICTED: tektin-3-like [Octopus bimaculoides]